MTDFSLKLCAAVKKHKCLHDRIALHKNAPLECRLAWEEVAKECNESMTTCKSRWSGLVKALFQSIKRRGCSRYYLHDHMKFLLGDKKKERVKRKKDTSENLNDETSSSNSMQPSLDEDLTQQEILMDTINIDEEEDDEDNAAERGRGEKERGDESDSHTTSADESNELNTSHEQVTNNAAMGVFIIDEIGQEVDEDKKRLSYKRACKRGLDADILNNELDELLPGEKRTRRSINDSGRSQNIEETKKLPIKIDNMDKIKINKPTFALKRYDKIKIIKRFPMVDNCTSMESTFHDVSTQYDMGVTHFDELFLESIKSQLQLMNARQKMNFKRRIYEAFLEVFDDNTDFPKGGDILKLDPKAAPKIFDANVGELRLMRELVSLVQAAKNTPEIIDNKEKVKIQNNAPSPTKSTPSINVKLPLNNDHNKNPNISPLSLSPSLEDDDDFQFSLDNIDDEDDIQLPKSWDEIKQKVNDNQKTQQKLNDANKMMQQQIQTQKSHDPIEENVMGLPKRVLQKVVRVSGSSGSTIVARDGDKKRIYRIYPKATTPNGLPMALHKLGSNSGTFYVTPNKNITESPSSSNKTLASLANNITIRNLQNKSTTSVQDSPITTTNNLTQTSPANVANKTPGSSQTVFKNVHPANRILSSSTGFFKMVQTTKNVTSPSNKPLNTSSTASSSSNTITRVIATKSPMLPPNVNQKRQIQVRSHIGSQMVAQRRYSVCGPVPSDRIQTGSPRNFIVNQPANKSTVSQIQISEPVSLNTKAQTSQQQQQQSSSSPASSTSNTATKSSSTNNTTATNNPTPKTATPTTEQLDVKPLKPLEVNLPNTSEIQAPEETPILETAGTIGADNFDPLFVKPPEIKQEPLDN